MNDASLLTKWGLAQFSKSLWNISKIWLFWVYLSYNQLIVTPLNSNQEYSHHDSKHHSLHDLRQKVLLNYSNSNTAVETITNDLKSNTPCTISECNFIDRMTSSKTASFGIQEPLKLSLLLSSCHEIQTIPIKDDICIVMAHRHFSWVQLYYCDQWIFCSHCWLQHPTSYATIPPC